MSHSASKMRVNALMALQRIRDASVRDSTLRDRIRHMA
jgi:hypothetical protein